MNNVKGYNDIGFYSVTHNLTNYIDFRKAYGYY